MQLDSQEYSSPAGTEMEVKDEVENIIQDRMDYKQPELELSLHLPPHHEQLRPAGSRRKPSVVRGPIFKAAGGK